MALINLTEAQLRVLREYVAEKAIDFNFNTGSRGPLEFLITVIVSGEIPSFTSSSINTYLNNKLTERLLAEKTALQARIAEIDAELNS